MSKANQSKADLQKLSEINLKNCVPACSVEDLNSKIVDYLILAQKMCGLQFVVTSGFRSLEHERSKGRKGTSSHCKGLAVDISTPDSLTRFKVVGALILSGFPRLGIGKTFVHADIDTSKPHPIIFHYYEPQET